MYPSISFKRTLYIFIYPLKCSYISFKGSLYFFFTINHSQPHTIMSLKWFIPLNGLSPKRDKPHRFLLAQPNKNPSPQRDKRQTGQRALAGTAEQETVIENECVHPSPHCPHQGLALTIIAQSCDLLEELDKYPRSHRTKNLVEPPVLLLANGTAVPGGVAFAPKQFAIEFL